MFKMFKKNKQKRVAKKQQKKEAPKNKAKRIIKNQKTVQNLKTHQNITKEIQKLNTKGQHKMAQTHKNYEILITHQQPKLVQVNTHAQQAKYFKEANDEADGQLLFDYDYIMNSIYQAVTDFNFPIFKNALRIITLDAKIDANVPTIMSDLTQLQYTSYKHTSKRYINYLIKIRAQLQFMFYKHNLTYVYDLKHNKAKIMKHMVGSIYEDCNYAYVNLWTKEINKACLKAMHTDSHDEKPLHLALDFLKQHTKQALIQLQKEYHAELKDEIKHQQVQQKLRSQIIKLDNQVSQKKLKDIKFTLMTLAKQTSNHPELESLIVNSVTHVFHSYAVNTIPHKLLNIFGAFYVQIDAEAIKSVQRTKSYRIMNQNLITWLQGYERNELLYQGVYVHTKHPKLFPPRSPKIASQLLSSMLNYIKSHHNDVVKTYTKYLVQSHKKYDAKMPKEANNN